MNKWLGRGALVLAVVVLLLASGLVLWALSGPVPQPEALDALRSDAKVAVERNSWLVFQPADQEASTGFIFYPGGRVDPRAYSLMAREIAEQGYLVVVVPMPLDLAVLGAGRASAVVDAFPEVERWAIGGHSLGGAMAANYAARNPDAIDGLALWAAYPASADDLSDRDLAVVSIYGTEDGLATPDKVNASRALLPADTQWVPIEGGNHAQFGSYGSQRGDNAATIDEQTQRDQVVAATVELLAALEGRD